MKSNLFVVLFLTFCWNESSRSTYFVSSHHTSKTRFLTKLGDFVKCARSTSSNKPREVIGCLDHMKLESDPYWQIMVENDLAHLEKGESDIVDAIKVFQKISSLLESKKIDKELNWNQLKELIDSEESFIVDFPDDDEGSGSYSGLPDDDESSGSYSGLPDQEGSGNSVGEKLADLDKFIREWNRLLINYGGASHTEEPNQELCTLPFVDVAYKVCILPVLDRQLSWHDARQYCRSRSLELAMDSAVIKGRKHFNNQLGEIGSRERWTLWVGGRKDEGKWEWSDGIPVPDFLWSKNQPRTFDRDSTPAGTCMAIHGFSEYYGAALPCHHRRRFVCQKM
ncbi:uncharacterized protein [Macrobrachium rosenbergii]|uniref:uncharacterized protein isoform X4 n=1 Tax=Macrobrachium rosenbergii TaxID=79674 RepID=UPI0034D73569